MEDFIYWLSQRKPKVYFANYDTKGRIRKNVPETAAKAFQQAVREWCNERNAAHVDRGLCRNSLILCEPGETGLCEGCEKNVK